MRPDVHPKINNMILQQTGHHLHRLQNFNSSNCVWARQFHLRSARNLQVTPPPAWRRPSNRARLSPALDLICLSWCSRRHHAQCMSSNLHGKQAGGDVGTPRRCREQPVHVPRLRVLSTIAWSHSRSLLAFRFLCPWAMMYILDTSRWIRPCLPSPSSRCPLRQPQQHAAIRRCGTRWTDGPATKAFP